MKLKTLKSFWVCVSEKGEVQWRTLAAFKRESIKAFVSESASFTVLDFNFLEKEYGWRCVKVNVDFTLVPKRNP